MAQQFEHLFRPIQLGPVTIPNRICFSAHATNFAEGNLPSERQAYYYAERAKGGAGWIVIGGSIVHESCNWLEGFNIVSDERSIPGYQRITRMVHDYGTKIFTQADHYGGVLPHLRRYRGPLLGPSGVPDVFGGETPKAVEEEDLEMIIGAYVRAAQVAKESQFDGIELISAQGFSIIEQFLSPIFNKRTDEYGGSLENRLRFPLRLFERVRKEVEGDLCMGIKLVGDELTRGGLTPEDIKEIAKRLAATGYLDYIHVCLGATPSLYIITPDMSFPPGFAAYLAAGVREVVNIPVVAIKRINDPVLAEKILAEGQADIIGMTRALIADPELPNKAKEGRLEDICQCTGVNQDCVGRMLQGHLLSCIQNPAVGEEKRWGIGTMVPARRKKKVLVVGGGPGGLKVAEIAAQRGHEVHLYEKGGELGGQVLSIIKVKSRQEFESIIRYLRIQVQKLGVKVYLGQEITAERVLAEGADAVVVATGSTPLKTGYSSVRPDVAELPGVEQDNVFTVFDVFGDGKGIGQRVVVVEEFGEMEGTMVAEYLADQGKEVEIVTRLPYVGMKIEPHSFVPQMERLAERKAVHTPFTVVTGIEGGIVRGEHIYTKAKWEREVDAVVLVMGRRANEELYFGLKGKVPELYRVGDCVAPRKITDAIYEGNIVGREI